MNPEAHADSERRRIARTAWLVTALAALVLFATAEDIGVTWDEPAHFAAAERHVEWFRLLASQPGEALGARVFEYSWNPYDHHPPLDRVVSGLVWEATRGFLDDATAHRAANMLLVAALVGLLYRWVAGVYGEVAGLAAAASLLTMPRFFFHAHLATLDIPVSIAITWVTALFFMRADSPGWRHDLALGAALGVALATKLNAFFAPPALFLWVVAARRRGFLFRRLLVMAPIGAAVAGCLWPWLWTDPLRHASRYLRSLATHFPMGQWYLGSFHQPPPWHYVFVIAWAVVPITITGLFLVGVVRAFRHRERDGAMGLLLVVSAVFPLLPLLTGKTWIYDGERLFMPAFPFVAALAGAGFGWIVEGIRLAAEKLHRARWRTPAIAAAAVLAFLPPLRGIAVFHPHLLSYYSAGVGGARGAARLGLETTYWCESYAAALPYINEHARPGDVVWTEPFSFDVLVYYQLQGKLRGDVEIAFNPSPEVGSVLAGVTAPGSAVSVEDADIVVLQYRQSNRTLPHEWLAAHTPVVRVEREGVPILDVYAR